MPDFKEYLRFPDIEKATEYTSVLEKYNIPFQLDDSSKRVKIIPVPIEDPWSDQYVLKLREADIERAEKAFNEALDNEVKVITNEHYLYSFEDKDIIDVIANQSDWTKEEVKLAMKIASERKLDLSAQSIKNAKRIKEEKPEIKSTIKTAAGSFWVIGMFTILNSVFIRKEINFHLPGLVISDIIESATAKVYGGYNSVGFFASLLISAVFFLFARYGKRNKWVFLSGLIIYFLDSLLVILSPRWGQILFIYLILWMLITALVNTMNESESQTIQQ